MKEPKSLVTVMHAHIHNKSGKKNKTTEIKNKGKIAPIYDFA